MRCVRIASGMLLLLWLGSGMAAEAVRWEDLSDPVFKRADLPEPVFPIAMVQDDEGFVWLGTQNGLFRWDGYGFRSIPVDPSQPGALPDGFINVLHKDRQGQLWLGMAAGGLARLNPATGELATIEMGPAGLSHVSVLSLCDDGEGGLWVGTARGLAHVDSRPHAVDRTAAQAHAQGLPEGRVNAVVQDSDGTLWVGTATGLFALARQDTTFRSVPLAAGGGDDAPVSRLMMDASGRLWIGTRSRGVFTVARGTRSAVPVRSTNEDDPALGSDSVKALLDLRDGRVWVGTVGGGIVEVRAATWSTRRIRHHQEVEASLPKDEVYTLLRDGTGRIWVGTDEALSSHDPMQRGITTWFGVGGRKRQLAHPNVNVVLPMPDDAVWLGGEEGVEIVDPVRGRIGQLQPDPAKPRTALPKGKVLAMARAADGTVYIGTYEGLYRADAAGRTVERIELAGRKDTAPAFALCAAGDRLWLGDLDGLWEIRQAPGKHVELLSREQLELGRSHVNSIACSDERTLWVGTHAGLARYDRVRGRIEWPETDAPGRVGMPRGLITAISTDARGRLWVASYGGGVRVLEPDSTGPAVLHRIGAGEGLPHNAANALLVDSRGDAWVSTDEGLARIAGDTLAVTMLRSAEGVGIRSYWTSSAAVTMRGDLLFGGVGGLTIVRPQDMGPRQDSPGTPAAPRGPPRFKTPIVLTTDHGLPVRATGITLEPSQRALQVTFFMPDYAAPERARYAYRLQGLEQAWTDSSTESRTARYTNLPPGDYTLEVKATNHSGEWVGASWPLYVKPTWYQTAPASAAMVMMSLGLASLVVRVRTRLLERRATMLGQLVARRTGELEHRTQELEVSREALRELGAHNLRALEEERKRVARELHDELGQQLAALNMEVAVLRACGNAGTVPASRQWDDLRGRVQMIFASMRRLVADLRPIALDAGVGAALEWLAVEFNRDAGVPCRVEVDLGSRDLQPDVAIVVFRIAQEALNNVRRHAHASGVVVVLRSAEDRQHLSISDDGVGFDLTRRRKGHGLLGMEERARLVDGLLEVSSRVGSGTRVSLTIGAC